MAFVLLARSNVIAQAPGAPVSGGPGTIVGVVRDTAGKPIESAQVSLGVAGPRTLTAADGSFRFERLRDTSYTVSARRIGYYPQSRWLTITDSGSVVQFSLVPVARVLPAVVAAVRRGGLSGVVEDSAHNALPNARVLALGSSRHGTTDSVGTFFIDLRPGKYMLQIGRDGFATRLISVTVPRDSGRRVVVGLRRATARVSAREAIAMFELRRRLVRATGPTRLFTREDLDRLGTQDVDRLVGFAVVRPVDPGCLAVIDGDERNQEPLWVLELSDVELLEVYSAPRRGRTRRRGPPDSRTIGLEACPSVFVWLRK